MPDRLHLPPKHRRVLEALLREHLPDVEVWAYGSRVSGKSHEGSDLDLVLRGPGLKEISLGQLGDFEEAVRESTIPFLVEARDWSRLPDRFHQEIERDHVVLLERIGGKVPGRQIKYLGEIANIVMGQSPPGDSVSSSDGLPLLNGPTEFGPHHPIPVQFTTDSRKYSQRGDILFCVRGSTTGRMNWADQRYAIGRGIAAICHKYDVAFQPFIRAVIEYALPELLAQATGSTFPNVSAHQLAAIPYPELDENEQRAAAQFLGSIDDKIELNRRMNETLEAMARALFKSWFVNFDPVRAKMKGRDPGLPKPLVDLFPDRLVDSEIGEVPEGWEVSRIGDELNAVGGSTPSTKEPSYWNCGEHNWATPKDLSKISSPVLLETDRKITDAGVNKISSGLLPAGTVLLSSRAPIGYIAVAEAPTAINQGFIAMVCNRRLPNLYVLFWCQDNLDHIKGISGGSTFAEISKKAFRPIRVTVPSHEVLSAYQSIARPLFHRLVENVKEVATLAQTRDLLLPKLISGTIRLNDVETYVK